MRARGLSCFDMMALRYFFRFQREEDSSMAEPGSCEVEVRTLPEICQEYCETPIGFLTIGVEGFEGEVLEGVSGGTMEFVS